VSPGKKNIRDFVRVAAVYRRIPGPARIAARTVHHESAALVAARGALFHAAIDCGDSHEPLRTRGRQAGPRGVRGLRTVELRSKTLESRIRARATPLKIAGVLRILHS